MEVLIIGDPIGHITEASQIAIARGAEIAHVTTVSKAMNALRAGQGAQVAMVDVNLDVGELATQLTTERLDLPIVAFGIGNDADAAVNAIKSGAKEYVPLPPDPELIAAVLVAVSQESDPIIHADPAMTAVLEFSNKIATTEAPALITGNPGTGKKLIARNIHSKSDRSHNNFVTVNCAGVPEKTIEIDLFGEKSGRSGKVEQANGGTLLLDKVNELPTGIQAKLLRLIQNNEINPDGATEFVEVDVRLIATATPSIGMLVQNGNFRSDLYTHLDTLSLKLPDLCERPLDIPVLANFFVKKYSHLNELGSLEIENAAMLLLENYNWPGNIRELENKIFQAVLGSVNRNMISTTDIKLNNDANVFPNQYQTPEREFESTDTSLAAKRALNEEHHYNSRVPRNMVSRKSPLSIRADETAEPESMNGDWINDLVGKKLYDVEKDLILATLKKYRHNRTHSANTLGISLRTLRNKIKEYKKEGIDIPNSQDQ